MVFRRENSSILINYHLLSFVQINLNHIACIFIALLQVNSSRYSFSFFKKEITHSRANMELSLFGLCGNDGLAFKRFLTYLFPEFLIVVRIFVNNIRINGY